MPIAACPVICIHLDGSRHFDWRKGRFNHGQLASSDAPRLHRPGSNRLERGAARTAGLAASTLERAKQDGFIRVGFANEAPFGFATPEGKLTGEAPEVAKAVLNAIGIPQVDGVLTEFGSLIPGLKAKRFDVIAAGMFITPKRCAEIAFSEPSYGIGQAMLVKAAIRSRSPITARSLPTRTSSSR